MSRTGSFSYAILFTGLISIIIGLIDLLNEKNSTDYATYVILSGLIMLLAGAAMVLSHAQNKMKAIGCYALAFGSSTILLSYGGIDTGYGDNLINVAYIIFGILFIFFGISFLRGNAKNLISKTIVSIFFILLYLSSLVTNIESLNILALENIIDIIVLVLFISLLLSKDVRSNTKRGKRKAKRNECDCTDSDEQAE